MNTLEEFATDAATEVAGPQPQINLAMIELIMQIVQQVLANCPASDAMVAKAIRSPTIRQRAKFRAVVSDSCDSCFRQQFKSNDGAIADACINKAKALTEAEALAIVFDATNPDFMVI